MTMAERLLDRLGDGAEDFLASYFEKYAGAYFETFGRNDPGRITSDDVIALTTLSISVGVSSNGFRPEHAIAFESRRDELADLLAQIPPELEISEVDEDQASELLAWDDSPVRRLYDFIRHNEGDRIHPGRVATYKLLARKRPALLAVRDSVVEKALDHVKPNDWWLPWWNVMQDARVRERLVTLRQPYADRASLLRIADIVVWMRERGR